MLVGDIVETARISVLHRLADKGNPAPRAGLVVHPYRVEGLAHIGAITQRHKPLQVECKLLPAHAYFHVTPTQWRDVSDEGHAQIGAVGVGRADAAFVHGAYIFQLGKHLPMRTNAQVCMHLQAMQQIAVTLAADAQRRGVVAFEALAQVDAERRIRCVTKRHIFQPIERLRTQSGIGKWRPVLLPAVRLDGRARRHCGSRING